MSKSKRSKPAVDNAAADRLKEIMDAQFAHLLPQKPTEISMDDSESDVEEEPIEPVATINTPQEPVLVVAFAPETVEFKPIDFGKNSNSHSKQDMRKFMASVIKAPKAAPIKTAKEIDEDKYISLTQRR